MKEQLRKIHSYLVIGDSHHAVTIAHQYAIETKERDAYLLWLKTLAHSYDEATLFAAWREIHEQFGDSAYDQDILETLSWAVIYRGSESFNPSLRLLSLLAGAVTQDIQGMKLIQKGLKDRHTYVRHLALELAGLYGDDPLKEEVIALYHREHLSQVKNAVITTAGKMRITALLPELIQSLGYAHTSHEEKKAIMQAVLCMKEELDFEQIRSFVQSDRVSLRMLACETIGCSPHPEAKALLLTLACDTNIHVKLRALQTLILLRIPLDDSFFQEHTLELDIMKGWADLLEQKERGKTLLKGIITTGDNLPLQITAAAAIAQAGTFGTDLALELWNSSLDDYVRANLALGFLWQRQYVEEAATFLASFLQNHSEPLMWGDSLFHPVTVNTLRYHPAVVNYPEAVNQACRLDILNLLAITGYSEAQHAIKAFLQESRWGISGIAATILLGEGDSTAIECIKQLLDDSNKEIRIQAALVLALWGRDHTSLPMLESLYHGADRNTKLKILEAFAKVGSPSMIPFLLQEMQQPSQSIRIAAAAAVLQILNH